MIERFSIIIRWRAEQAWEGTTLRLIDSLFFIKAV